MSPAFVLIAAATLGVEAGWNELPQGGFEYVIQIEPQLLPSLGRGESISSEIPPEMRGARRYRIVVGTGPLPNQGRPPASGAAATAGRNPNASGPAQQPAAPRRQASAPLSAPDPGPEKSAMAPPLLPQAAKTDAIEAAGSPGGKELRRPGAGRAVPPIQPPNSPLPAELTAPALSQIGPIGLGPPEVIRVLPSSEAAANPAGGPEGAPAAESALLNEPVAPIEPASSPLSGDRWNNPPPQGSQGPRSNPRAANDANGVGSRWNEPFGTTQPPATTPDPLAEPPSPAPLARQAGYEESPARHVELPKADLRTSAATTPAPGGADVVAAASDAPRPWMPLVLVVFMLTLSLGGNAYLGWNWLDLRNRYRRLQRQPAGEA